MTRRIRALSLAAVAVVSWAAHAADAVVAPATPQGEPLAVEASALVPLESESTLKIVGIQGQIIIIARDARELRVLSRAQSAGGADLPVGIWQEGSKLIVAPAPGQPAGGRVLRVEVPRSFALDVSASGSEVVIDSMSGSVDLQGKELKASIRSCTGSVDVDLTGGSLVVRDSGSTTLKLVGTSLEVGAMIGDINVRMSGKDATLRELHGAVDIETEGTVLIVEGASAALHLKAHQGSVSAKGIAVGAELEITGAPLRLEDGKGDITVTSDASVEFATMAASLHFDMYGGSLRGKGNQGLLEVRTRNTEVNVESIDQGMRIQGDGLKARIVDITGDLYVEASVSDVIIDRVAAVDLRLDRGSATLQHASGSVQAIVVGADIHIIDGAGPVILDLDGGEAEVSWASIGGDKDSQLVNKSGAVTARFPAGASCRVEAKSKYGRVDSELPTVKVLEDANEAQGPLNGGRRPTIRIIASGDIHLLDGLKSHDEN